jgi:threonine dehydrogenase-like Zn-dependent dehydrogenase
MKSAIHTGLKEMTIKETAIPQPAPNEYLVQIKACAICGSDTWWNMEPWENEAVHGHESAGVIVQAPEDGKYKIGDRVVCYAILGCGKCAYCRDGKPTLCGAKGFIEGGFQEYAVFPEALLFPCPDEYDFTTASMLSDAIGVPLHGMRRLPPRTEDNVCVWGMGPLGLLQVMFLRAAGVRNIIALDTVKERLDKALELGAAHVLNASDPELAANIRALTNGTGADKAYTYVRNDKATVQVFETTRSEAEICTFVGLDGQYTLPEYYERTLVWSFYFNPPEYPENLSFLKEGNIDLKPLVSHTFPLEKIQEAFRMRFEQPALSNKIVITME